VNLQERLIADGATLAPDGIPLQFSDLASEYDAALNQAVLLVRSHEGRLAMYGRDRLALMHRISTNHLEALKAGEGAATIFTNANARIIDRAVVLSRDDRALILTEPGRGPALENMLRRNIFFNDDARLENITESTVQFALHGPQADAVMATLLPATSALPLFGSAEVEVGVASVIIARNKPLAGAHWTVIAPVDSAAAVWEALLAAGKPFGLRPAGSLTYNTLRIRAGRPGVGRELSDTYIPLEVGLWDEISFRKGCYTGQEIIARMESRNRLARVMVSLSLSAPVDAPADLLDGGKIVGRVTSSVTTPQGEHLGIAVIKTDSATLSHRMAVVGSNAIATVTGFAAVPPPMVESTNA
jgi:folate-binding protein YgfZ